MTPSQYCIACVDRAVTSRRSTKVIAEADFPTSGTVSPEAIDEIVAVAGLAPFHHVAPPSRRAEAAEPWRCHTLDASACRWLRAAAEAEGVTSKILGMLSAAEALVLVTCLPEGAIRRPSAADPRVTLQFEGTLVNMEHAAASGAFAQNVLVAATARGLATYWSSGGWLATNEGLSAIGAGADEVLIGALFVFPDEAGDAVVKHPGKHHAKRSPLGAWARRVEAGGPENG